MSRFLNALFYTMERCSNVNLVVNMGTRMERSDAELGLMTVLWLARDIHIHSAITIPAILFFSKCFRDGFLPIKN